MIFFTFFYYTYGISKTPEENLNLLVKEWLLMLLCKGRVYSQHSVNIVCRAIWLNWMLNINIGKLKRYRNWCKSSIETTARRSNPYGTGGTEYKQKQPSEEVSYIIIVWLCVEQLMAGYWDGIVTVCICGSGLKLLLTAFHQLVFIKQKAHNDFKCIRRRRRMKLSALWEGAEWE